MQCGHDYKVLEDNIEVEQSGFYDDGSSSDIEVKGHVIFYCRKCTDIQKVVLE